MADPSSAPLPPAVLPPGVRSRFVSGINGLTMHVLEAGFEEAARPCALLLHGFPELAYSWRGVMPALAAAGYHVVAPTSAATAAPPDGTPASMPISAPSACSASSAMRWRWCPRSAADRSPR